MAAVTGSTSWRERAIFLRRGLLERGHEFFIVRHRWTYALIGAMTCAAAAYVLAQHKVALASENVKPHNPPGAGVTLSSPPRHIAYEVTSPTNSKLTVSYLDARGQAHLFTGPGPWRTSITTTDIASLAGVTALTTNGTVACKITVDGEAAAEQTQTGGTPSVTCNLNAFQQSLQ